MQTHATEYIATLTIHILLFHGKVFHISLHLLFFPCLMIKNNNKNEKIID